MKQADLAALLITLLILTYKTISYIRKFSNKPIYCWMYFGRNEIMLSSTKDRRIAKEKQNLLSLVSLIGFYFRSACIC